MEPRSLKLEVLGCGRQLQRIEPGGYAGLERQILATQRAHQDLQSPILVEHDLGRALPMEHREQEADEDRLPRSRGTANERMSRIFATTAVGIRRVTRMEREVVR